MLVTIKVEGRRHVFLSKENEEGGLAARRTLGSALRSESLTGFCFGLGEGSTDGGSSDLGSKREWAWFAGFWRGSHNGGLVLVQEAERKEVSCIGKISVDQTSGTGISRGRSFGQSGLVPRLDPTAGRNGGPEQRAGDWLEALSKIWANGGRARVIDCKN